jgi:Holliday junction resolvase RusA-like endonuclease
MTITFVAYGRPQQKGSHRALPIRRKTASGALRAGLVVTDDNPLLNAWDNRVAAAAFGARNGSGLILTPVGVALDFYFARPKSHYGSGRNAQLLRKGAPDYHTTKPDIDKLSRAVLDAITGILIRDDRQVVTLDAAKHYGDPECVKVRISTLEDLAISTSSVEVPDEVNQ